MKKKVTTILIIFIAFTSCQTDKELLITSMADGINYTPKYKVQYFEIDNYSKYPDSILMDKILLFSQKMLSANHLMPPKVKTQHFYKKTLFGGCKNIDKISEAESDGEDQAIRDCRNEHIARIWIIPTEDKKNDSIYDRDIVLWKYGIIRKFGNTYSTKRDSILIKGKEWKILKKGKIESHN